MRNFQINGRSILTAKCLLTFSHYIYIPYSSKAVLELQVCSYCLSIGQDQLNNALTMKA